MKNMEKKDKWIEASILNNGNLIDASMIAPPEPKFYGKYNSGKYNILAQVLFQLRQFV